MSSKSPPPSLTKGEGAVSAPVAGVTARAEDHGLARVAMVIGTLAAVLLSVHQLFNLRFFGIVLIEGLYLYLLAGIFLSLAFLCFRLGPGRPKQVPW